MNHAVFRCPFPECTHTQFLPFEYIFKIKQTLTMRTKSIIKMMSKGYKEWPAGVTLNLSYPVFYSIPLLQISRIISITQCLRSLKRIDYNQITAFQLLQ